MIIAYQPFLPVAISNCRLKCKHCMGKYLNGMKKIFEQNELLKFDGRCGILISGGFDREGRLINLEKMLPAIKKIRERVYVAIHPGFVNRRLAEEIAEACDIAFVDLPCNGAIRNVFGLRADMEKYFENMELLLDAGMDVTPHITLGLNYGKIEEWEVLKRLEEKGWRKRLVINIVMATRGTDFEKIRVDEEEVIDFIVKASEKFEVVIGCMRPRSMDVKLIEAGVKRIAVPSRRAVEGKEVVKVNACCGVMDKLHCGD